MKSEYYDEYMKNVRMRAKMETMSRVAAILAKKIAKEMRRTERNIEQLWFHLPYEERDKIVRKLELLPKFIQKS